MLCYQHFLCWYLFSLSHFVMYFCFHIALCISAVAAASLSFHMPCCISISVLVCVCHYEWSLSQIILFLISHLITHFPDAHYGFQCSCYIIHGGDVFAVNHWLFTTCYRFFFLHLIMHLISHNSFCVFPIVSHDSLLNLASYFIFPLLS